MNTPNGWKEVIALFGDPNKYRDDDGRLSPRYEMEHIVRVPLPRPMPYVEGSQVTKIAVNKAIATIAAETMAAVAQRPDLWDILIPYAGCFEPRLKRDSSSRVSLHTLGIALDFNPNNYPLGSTKRMPADLVRIFTDRGWFYGGDFHGRKDPMHFQFAEGV